jgi:predicted outer membrane repeat protein
MLVRAAVAMSGTTWYVNGLTGSDTNSCKASQTACKTIGHAISLAASGDSIVVAAATYMEHLVIRTSLNLRGSGAGTTVIDGGGSGGTVVGIYPGIIVSIADVTIRNGQSNFGGGGVRNEGTLELIRSAIVDNYVIGLGTGAAGGGIYNDPGATLTLNDSTVAANHLTNTCHGPFQHFPCWAYGGGISNLGRLVVNNSTISGNTIQATLNGVPSGVGGGIKGGGELNNTTVARNSANGGGGGIYGGTTVTQNSILANNAGGNCGAGSIISSGFNLSSDATCQFAGPGDKNNAGPKLGTLGNNGGPTETIPLLAGSPAIDSGNPGGCTDSQGNLLKTDQRGMPRPDLEDKTGCDMGAYESQSD